MPLTGATVMHAKDYHNEGKIYATDDTHADGAQKQGKIEMSVFHMVAINHHVNI